MKKGMLPDCPEDGYGWIMPGEEKKTEKRGRARVLGETNMIPGTGTVGTRGMGEHLRLCCPKRDAAEHGATSSVRGL